MNQISEPDGASRDEKNLVGITRDHNLVQKLRFDHASTPEEFDMRQV